MVKARAQQNDIQAGQICLPRCNGHTARRGGNLRMARTSRHPAARHGRALSAVLRDLFPPRQRCAAGRRSRCCPRSKKAACPPMVFCATGPRDDHCFSLMWRGASARTQQRAARRFSAPLCRGRKAVRHEEITIVYIKCTYTIYCGCKKFTKQNIGKILDLCANC